MLRFHPAGFVQTPLATDLGVMVYYTNVEAPAIGTPTLVFLHSLGGGSSAFEWCRVYPALADTYRVVAPDLIGWGQSSHPVRTYWVEDYFTMITQLLTSLEGPRLVAATSLTAGVMVRLAIQRPDLCQGLFLVSPAGNSDFGRDYRLSLPALLASLNPQAITTIHEIPDAGVLPHLECPEAVVPLLRDFAGMVLASHQVQ